MTTHEIQSIHRVQEVMKDVTFKEGWGFFIGRDQHRLYLQVRFRAPCSVTGELRDWSGRKWQLSEHMTRSEIVGTAFMAVMAAVEHETRESFRYKDRAIYQPHYNVDQLAELCGRGDHLDVREVA